VRTPGDGAIEQMAEQVIRESSALFDEYQFSRALESAWTLVAAVNKYIVENEPWALAEKQEQEHRARLGTVLYTAAEALRVVTALVHPVIPESSARIWAQLGLGDISRFRLSNLKWGQLELGTKLGAVQPVFPRADKTTVGRMQAKEQKAREVQAEAKLPVATAAGAASGIFVPGEAQSAGSAAATVAPSNGAGGKITIDDFAKVELRVGQVTTAEKVKGADKLLRLEVDIGTEVRQIVAGIAEAYAPESLVGRKVVIVANLQPRKLRGLESNGMIVAASLGDGKPVLASFLEDVPVGARLK
jgi:methionyl-tRNA synthetase